MKLSKNYLKVGVHRCKHQDCTAHLEVSHVSYAHLLTPSFPPPHSPPLPPHTFHPSRFQVTFIAKIVQKHTSAFAFHQVHIPSSPPLCINDPYHQWLLPAPTISEDNDVAITAPSSSLAQQPTPLSAVPDVNASGLSSVSYFQSFIPLFSNTDLQWRCDGPQPASPINDHSLSHPSCSLAQWWSATLSPSVLVPTGSLAQWWLPSTPVYWCQRSSHSHSNHSLAQWQQCATLSPSILMPTGSLAWQWLPSTPVYWCQHGSHDRPNCSLAQWWQQQATLSPNVLAPMWQPYPMTTMGYP